MEAGGEAGVEAAEGRIARLVPALPTLLGLQLVVVALLAGTWWRAQDAPGGQVTPLETQVLQLETAAASAAVEAALVHGRQAGRALLAADESRTASFLSLTASSVGLAVTGVRFEVGPSALPAAQAVDVTVELSGDAFDLPVFLDGVQRQAALSRVEAVAAVVQPGGAAKAWIMLRYHRAVLPAAEELEARVARTVPAARDETRALLARAGEVAAWEHFASHVDARASAATQAQERLARDLPAALVQLRLPGGKLTWTAAAGLEVEPLQ